MKHLWVLFLAGLLLVGCGSGVSIVGKYKVEMPAASADDPAAKLAEGFASMMALEFKADNTFSMSLMEGTYTVSGDIVEMKPTKVMGVSVEEAAKQGGGMTANAPKSMQMRIEDGGKTLVPIGEGADAAKTGKFVKM